MDGGMVAWVDEIPGPDDYFFASGRFSGAVTTAEGDEEEQLEDATLDDALCWARERAEVVRLGLHDRRRFSAGTRHIDSDLSVWEDGTVVEPRRLNELTVRIPSGAMAPTLQLGQLLRVPADAGYDPQIGDIVLFHPPIRADRVGGLCGDPEQGAGHSAACSRPIPQRSSQAYIKRIVAGPDDTLAIVEGRVIRNEEPASEPFAIAVWLDKLPAEVTHRPEPNLNFPTPITIPPDHYFLLGDNRPESDDSRYWGPVPRAWIIGKLRVPDANDESSDGIGSESGER
jgi:signal peptidase I